MADWSFDKQLSGSADFSLYLDITLTSQNEGANTSTLAWALRARDNDSINATWSAYVSDWAINVNTASSGTKASFDFRDGDLETIASGTKTVTHDSEGRKTLSVSGTWESGHSAVGSATVTGTLTLPRIAKAPDAPAAPSLGTETTTSVPLSWSAPDNNGASITGYTVQRATNSGFSTGVATTSASSTSVTVSGLSSGTDYWFRVRATNSAGNGSYGSARATATLPVAPTSLATGSVTPTSFTLSWTAPSGSGIDGYDIQQSTTSSFTSPTTWSQTGTSRAVSGLSPATTYFYRVRAKTSGGAGAWSSTRSVTPGLPAPSITIGSTNTSTWKFDLAWSAPASTTGLIGYRIQASTKEDFSSGVTTFDVGNVLTASLTLAGGKWYWFRVAARTAGGVNTWSTVMGTVHSTAAGNTDGWSRSSTRPGPISEFTASGVRRATLASKPALYVETMATGATTMPADSYGIAKTLTGLTPGTTYRVQASVTAAYSAAPTTAQARTFRVGVGSTMGTTATPITTATGTVTLPYLDFVASSSTAIFRVLMADALTISGWQEEVERYAVHSIHVWAFDSDYGQRLRDTVYESNLANHFDLACNSVGASWYVDTAGITRFRLPGEALPTRHIFTDVAEAGALEYVDLTAGYDTRSLVNLINVTNKGVDAAGTNEENDELIVQNTTSQTAYGIYSANLDTNLYDQAPYEDALDDLLAGLLDANDEPTLLISALRWNAQQSLPAALALEVGQRVLVRYRGTEQDSQIVAIHHEITPTRWMVSLDLRKL